MPDLTLVISRRTAPLEFGRICPNSQAGDLAASVMPNARQFEEYKDRVGEIGGTIKRAEAIRSLLIWPR